MTPERWRQVSEVFHAALGHDVAARAAYVRDVCAGDRGLQEEVDAMLAAHAEPGQFGAVAVSEILPLTTLTPGSQLGPYTIEGALGIGGMGEVYRAHDPRLRRAIALKILPPEFARDAARSARFKREAQALAALNHPNIVTIYSVEEVSAIPFITMELVDGGTLPECIPPTGLASPAVIRLAHDIAEGIAAAHERGITHRDLKPGNLMVAGDGRVKILDFGLARFHDPLGGSEGPPRPEAENLTAHGAFVGTVAYMSPEQAEGKPVDHRSDIFSLGVVLHEMATGERPFKGESPISVITAILRDEPPLVSDIRPVHPAALAQIIRRCLQKDPARRYQTATDLRNDLDGLSREPATETRRGRRIARRYPAMAIAALALVVFAAIGAWILSYDLERETSFAVGTVERLTSDGQAELAAMSGDGRYVVHVKEGSGRPSLWLRQTAARSDVQIMPPSDVRYSVLSFSRDDNYVYFATYATTAPGKLGRGRLFMIPVLGGSPKLILDDVDGGVDFSPAGDRLTFFRMAGVLTQLMIANRDGTDSRMLATLGEGERVFLFDVRPSWSPDGKTIVAAVLPKTGAEVYAVDVDTGRMHSVAGTWGGIVGLKWMPDGGSMLLVASAGSGQPYQIWQVHQPSERRTRVTNDVNTYSGVHVSTDGRTLATIQWAALSQIWITDLDSRRSAKQITSRTSLDGGLGLAWAPDDRIVFISTRTGRQALWIMNADGSDQRQLADRAPAALNPTITPDGKSIVFEGSDASGDRIWRMDVDGASAAPITPGPFDWDPVVTPDQRWVYYTSQHPDRPGMHRIPLTGGEPASLDHSSVLDAAADGRVLVLSGEPGDSGTVAYGFVGSFKRVEGVPSLLHPLNRFRTVPVRFTDGGRALLYGDTVNGVSNVWRKRLSGGRSEQMTDFATERIFAFAQSRDGRRLAVARGTIQSDVVLMRRK